MQSKNLKVLHEERDSIFTKSENVKLAEVLCSLLDPFLECYYAVCCVLLAVGCAHLHIY